MSSKVAVAKRENQKKIVRKSSCWRSELVCQTHDLVPLRGSLARFLNFQSRHGIVSASRKCSQVAR